MLGELPPAAEAFGVLLRQALQLALEGVNERDDEEVLLHVDQIDKSSRSVRTCSKVKWPYFSTTLRGFRRPSGTVFGSTASTGFSSQAPPVQSRTSLAQPQLGVRVRFDHSSSDSMNWSISRPIKNSLGARS